MTWNGAMNGEPDGLRRLADPYADAVVQELYVSGKLATVNHALTGPLVASRMPESLAEFLEITAEPPAWADRSRLARVPDFFSDGGVHVALVLSLSAMVTCYALPHNARLLAFARHLNRPRQGCSMLALEMMAPDAFDPGGRFIPEVQRVRLIHAAVRHQLNRRGSWSMRGHGEPLCQEDLLIVLLVYVVHVLDGLERLRVNVTEAEAYFHAWQVTGFILGLQEAVIPRSLEEARMTYELLMRRNSGPSPEGIQLTRDLMARYERLFAGHLGDSFVPALTRRLAGDEIANWLHIPHSRWDRFVYSDRFDRFLPTAETRILARSPWTPA